MVLSLSVRDLGPIAELSCELPRLTIVYGRVGTGKSYIFRLLTLLYLARPLAQLWGYGKDYVKALARLVVLEYGEYEEALSLDPSTLARWYVPNLLLRRGVSRGSYSLGNLISLTLAREELSLEIAEELDDYLIVYVPQERNPILMARDLENLTSRIRKLFGRWREVIPPYVQMYMVMSAELARRNPVYINYLLHLLIAAGLFTNEQSSVVESVEIGRGHELRLVIERPIAISIEEVHGSEVRVYDLETPLVLPQGALDYLLLALLIKALKRAHERSKDIYSVLIVDEFMTHADPLLVLKALDLVLETLSVEDRMYAVLITHNPDILSRLLNVLQHNEKLRSTLLNQVALLYLEYSPEKRGTVGYISRLQIKDGVVIPEKEIPWLEEYVAKLTSPTEVPR